MLELFPSVKDLLRICMFIWKGSYQHPPPQSPPGAQGKLVRGEIKIKHGMGMMTSNSCLSTLAGLEIPQPMLLVIHFQEDQLDHKDWKPESDMLKTRKFSSS